MARRWTATVIALATALSTASAQEIVGRDESVFSLTERVGTGQWVRIASPNGAVRITRGTSSQVEIRAEKTVRRGSIEDVGFIVHRSDGGVTVCAVYDDDCGRDGSYRSADRPRGWWDRHQIRVDFTVQVPAGVRVRGTSGNGDVSISGTGAEVVASTGNGRVDVSETTGEVRATSGNGRVTVDGARGPVEVSTGNGDIRVATSRGPVSARSGNGDIDVAMDELDGSPDMEFTTGNGRITLTVPDGFGAELRSNTGNGRVDVDFPLTVRGRITRHRVDGTLGNGGGRLELRTGNGNLEIRRKS